MCNRQHDIYFAGGCFWGVEKYFSCIEGVVKTETGYANGNGTHPTYEDVCRSTGGFAECVHVIFDPDIVSLSFLLHMFYEIIDPTSLNRQGNDRGIQYRSGVYYTKRIDALIIEESLLELQKEYDKALAIEVGPLKNFYRAEEYHQSYLDHNPNGYCHIPSFKFKEAKNARCFMKKEKEERFRKKNDHELRMLLNEEQYEVTQHAATEPPFQNAYWNTFEKGIYIDITTGEPLFVSDDKFSSGCGWPSFSKPIDTQLLNEVNDTSHGMKRVEVRSKKGNAHLGHVFDDGPEEAGGLRYCINSAALKFIPESQMEESGYGDYLYLLHKQ